MDSAWKWKATFIAAIALLCGYALVPSVVYFRMSPDVRNDNKAFEAQNPKWASQKHLNLGLDLQGGVHLVMGVEVDKAVRDKAVRRADEVKDELARKEIKDIDVVSDPDQGTVTVTGKTAAATKAARKEAEDYFQDMFTSGSTGESFSLKFRDASVKALKDSAVDQAIKTIRNRVDQWGVSEPTIARRGADAILVQLPGFKDPEKAKELLGRTAQLEFKIVDDDDQSVKDLSSQLPPGITIGYDSFEGAGGAAASSPYLKGKDRKALQEFANLHKPKDREFGIEKMAVRPGEDSAYRTWLLKPQEGMTGEYIQDARVSFDNSPGAAGRPYTSLTFNRMGADIFQKLTKEHVKKRMAIVLDDTVDSAPVIQAEIAGGNAQITLGGLKPAQQVLTEARDLALVLKSGSLPAPVRILEERSVGASLGPELVRKGTIAAIIGFLLVVAFMIFYYRLSGAIADVALAFNGIMVLAAMAGLGSTLTLPGIAGLVLTLGMAVDANVLINERIREELRTGKSVRSAVQAGYDKVFWTIFDGHVTALVAGVVIRSYGSGPVQGFATTLIIGLLASMFTSIVVTRAIIEFFVESGKLERISI